MSFGGPQHAERDVTTGAPTVRDVTRAWAWGLVLAGYALLGTLVVVGFDRDVVVAGALFVLVNFWVSAACVWLLGSRPVEPLHVLLYGMFVAAYVAKGVLQYLVGLDTAYTLDTIRTSVSPEDYGRALAMVTAGHVVVVGVLAAASRLSGTKIRAGRRQYLDNASAYTAVLALLAWVVVSSLVMRAFGVAVMGTAGVSLPYKMSAVLYYSRLIAVPMALLYCVEKAVATDDVTLLRASLGLFVLLAVSEVVVRATKAPPFIMVVQVVVLLSMLGGSGAILGRRTRRDLLRALTVVFALGLALWPLMEVYRIGVAGRLPSDVVTSALGSYLSENARGAFAASLEAAFNRAQGFLQFAGLVATPEFRHEPLTVLGYGDVATYYTGHYLGYHTVGHASSPSLLGAALILGGPYAWPLVLAAYLVVLLGLWRLAEGFRHMAVPVACFVATEGANVVIGGTLEGSLLVLAMVFGLGLLGELLLRSSTREEAAS